jgi:hypothetical protein
MNPEESKETLVSELMIMPDGRIYAHNLTSVMAAVLGELNPADETIRQRAITHVGPEIKKLLPESWDAENPKTEIRVPNETRDPIIRKGIAL